MPVRREGLPARRFNSGGLIDDPARTGPRSFEYQDKTNGTVNYTSRFTVSDDGTTLTEDQTMATGEKWHIVYDREK